jgi:KUP system potassium uptake protein
MGGLLVTLGIIYGDIGTSPLYVMKSIIHSRAISELLVYGSISAVFWTLTLQTTLKYVVLTLRADNKGEGGIFSLYTLVRRRADYLVMIALVGGAMLLADGIITPPISVASAVEGLRIISPEINTVPIVVVIITLLFFFQRLGTSIVGKFFGPIMFLWFGMLAVLGLMQVVHHPEIFKALNPIYAYRMLSQTPNGFLLLSGVFLCTTGAEALYSDLGHCGKPNIRISWFFVKICLIINYLGQAAWLMTQQGTQLNGRNPFFSIMPSGFLLIGVGIATMAAIIASQALISGSFTLVSEAIKLGLMPKLTIKYPSVIKGQLYIPAVNTFLWLGCLGIVFYFRESSNMEGAYGLAITLTMLMTTILLAYYLRIKRVPKIFIALFLFIYIGIEGSFLIANMFKFLHGGYVTLILSGALALLMWAKLQAKLMKRELTNYVSLKDHLNQLKELSNDAEIPKYATHLVYLTTAVRYDDIEQKILYSILQSQPKRADLYWFVHIDVTDEPYTMNYKVKILAEEDVIKITLKLGFRVQQGVDIYVRQIINDMIQSGEIHVQSKYHLANCQEIGDFKFVIVNETMSNENELNIGKQFIMDIYFKVNALTTSPEKWFGIDASQVVVENYPLVIKPMEAVRLRRVENGVPNNKNQ